MKQTVPIDSMIVEKFYNFFFVQWSEDKRSLRILEEDLLQMYTGSLTVESLKEQQFKELQLEESQALASENYDLAEEISDRMEKLKTELESARYRLPAQDNKVQ